MPYANLSGPRTWRSRPFFVFFGLAFALASYPNSALTADGEYAAIHTISIVPGFGHKADVWMRSADIWDRSTVQIDWDVDQSIVQKATQLLGKRFSFTPSPVDPQLFLEDIGKLNSSDRTKIAAVPAAQRPDAYVVIGSTSPDAKGLWIESPSRSYNSSKTIFTTLVFLNVYDGKTGERIDYGSGHDTSVECGTVVDPEKSGYSAEQKVYIQQVLSNWLDGNVARALQGAKLVTEDEAKHSMDASIATASQQTCTAQSLLGVFRTR